MKVVLFTGGRGSTVLSRTLVRHKDIALTILINGYDDGASTGAVRQYLGDSLGPSDFRKNASRFARELGTCEESVVSLLDKRLPVDLPDDVGRRIVQGICSKDFGSTGAKTSGEIAALSNALSPAAHNAIARRLNGFLDFSQQTEEVFNYEDCSLGNLVFAGSFLAQDHNFNQAIDDYCQILGLPAGMIVNVTDGANLFLVALDKQGKYLPREVDIVDSAHRTQIKDIFLLPTRLDAAQQRDIENMDVGAALDRLQSLSRAPRRNESAIAALQEADLIVYSPGTQHSSLFPSYVTPGIGDAIASNLSAIKVFISNIHEDAEIADANAVQIVHRAIHYLNQKGEQSHPTPALITHYLFNRPKDAGDAAAYITPGNLDILDDPQPVRVGDYEDGKTGLHDADKALTPFIQTILARDKVYRIGVFMLNTVSSEKVVQSLVQMLWHSGSAKEHRIDLYCSTSEGIESRFQSSLPFRLHEQSAGFDINFIEDAIDKNDFDFVVLYESSGMYHGGDVMKLISALSANSLDVVWGSRRLSVNDIHDSYRLRYHQNILLGSFSYIGSHFLSLLYLLLYGRYVSDTLSGIRVLRSDIFKLEKIELDDPTFNQRLLSAILGNKFEILEMPVRFLPQSPQKVKRTTVLDGLKSVLVILLQRIKWFGTSRERTGN